MSWWIRRLPLAALRQSRSSAVSTVFLLAHKLPQQRSRTEGGAINVSRFRPIVGWPALACLVHAKSSVVYRGKQGQLRKGKKDALRLHRHVRPSRISDEQCSWLLMDTQDTSGKRPQQNRWFGLGGAEPGFSRQRWGASATQPRAHDTRVDRQGSAFSGGRWMEQRLSRLS
ncbi:hypothetical protein B0J18DRAFT_110744 [Chaetomium sp. MPI-SDFR-AT-0129]|nr:hypothetical protein B0J18DRAFT_110744 [Chaetomium sp. MPI-SDFR-AT-0129]